MTEPIQAHDPFVHPTIPVRFVREMVAFVAKSRRAGLLAQAGIPAGALGQDKARVSGAQTQALHHAVARALDDELYGYLRRPVPRGAFAALMKQATGCRDMQATLLSTIDFYHVFAGGPLWRLEVEGSIAKLTLTPRTEQQHNALLFMHAMLLTPWRAATWLLKQSYQLERVVLNRRFRDYRSEAQFLFGREPEWTKDSAFVHFDAEVLKQRPLRHREEVDAWARHDSFYAVIGRPPLDSLQENLRSILTRCRPVGSASRNEAADALGLSAQALGRGLRKLGLSFRSVKEAVRRDHAIARLTAGEPVATVAESLGFSEPSAFMRAFKEWTGLPPGRYRRK